MIRRLFKLSLLAGIVYAGKRLYDTWSGRPGSLGPTPGSSTGTTGSLGRDTATGTDPDAKYAVPGYEDKSFGQAVAQDQALVDRLVEEEHGDTDLAAARFETESAGAPAIAHQHDRPSG